MDLDLNSAKKKLYYLSRGLMAHCWRTSQLCRELARHWGESEERAAWAGLVHDLARPYPDLQLLWFARQYGLAIHDIEQFTPLLLHGPVGAEVLERQWGVDDAAVLESVRCHTSGARDMGLLVKIVFLADKLEPGKAHLYPHLEPVRQAVHEDLDRALLEFFNSQITFLLLKESRIHPAMLEARDYLRLKVGG